MADNTGRGNRTRGTVLLDKPSSEVRGTSACVNRLMDVEIYNLTGEVVYLGEEESELKRQEAMRLVALMKKEVTTVEQFRTLGGTAGVSQKYSVGLSTAAKYYHELTVSERAQTRPELAPIEGRVAFGDDSTPKPVNVAYAANLTDIEKFHTDVEEPDLSKVAIGGVGKDAPTVANQAGGKQSQLDYRFDLIDAKALFAMAKVLHEGEVKYGPDNWRKINVDSHLNHALSHIYAYFAGDKQDDHLSHALCRTMMALGVWKGAQDGN
jgi:hypothetical protein